MKTKINILRIVGSPQGGIGKHVADLSTGLDPKIFNTYLCASFDKMDNNFKSNMESIQLSTQELIELNIEKKPSYLDIINIYQLYQKIKNKDIDIIHGHGAKGGLYARVLGFLIRKKTLYSPHGGSLHAVHGFIGNLFYLLIEQFLILFTNLIVFDSEYCKKILKKLIVCDKQIQTNFLGIDIKEEKVKKKFDTNNVNILAVGQLRYLKGHDILIHAVAKLLEEGYNIKLDICGFGEEYSNLLELIQQLKVDVSVKLHGDVESTEPYFLNSDIVVHPSRFEAFGYVPIEAMNYSKLVIVANTGGLSDIVTHKINGLVFKKDDIQELANNIKLLIDDATLRKEILTNSENILKRKFSKTSMLKNIKKFI